MLAFPEPGIDDTAAYQGYQTRFYRDSKNNTVQIYLQPQTSRVVLVWADAANESVGFSVKNAAGRPLRMEWGAPAAVVSDSGTARSVEYALAAPVSRIELGWFVLGSMRIERDFVYANRYLKPFGGPAFQVAEESLLVADVARLPPEERRKHLSLLNTGSVVELASRLTPGIDSSREDTVEAIRIQRSSLDGRHRLVLQLRVDPRRVKLHRKGQTIALETRPGSPLRFRVRVTTDAAPLTPLSRNEIFSQQFLDFLERSRATGDTGNGVTYRRLERQVRGVELLSSQEKLMAGLPNFATYFGRDMMMTALMMRPIWTPEMSEHVIVSVLRKLGPNGEVSHEEALAGQAVREHAGIYDSLLTAWFQAGRDGSSADSILERAGQVLRDLQRTRENYHMIDDEFQLPVLAAAYLSDSSVSADRKRAFLRREINGVSGLKLLLQELSLVASLSAPYVRDQRPTNLVSFPRLDSTRWRSASWRDSDAGYAGGRFAMDINVIWVPKALQSIATIISELAALDYHPPDTLLPDVRNTPLGGYLRDAASLRRAIEVWSSAGKHFRVTLGPPDIQRRVRARLAWLPSAERRYWQNVIGREPVLQDSLSFLALSLDSAGRPIPIPNTDPATDVFLNPGMNPDTVLGDIAALLHPYPAGLFVQGLGPLVANDVYAPRAIWERFQADQYHGPRVVWGREVNLLLLGLANQIARKPSRELEGALHRILDAVHASGLQHNELWSYQIKGGKLLPVRYGTSSDVQLWNTTNLVVQYVLSQLPD